MAKLYKYNGAWETYQYLHDDVGFNTESTNSVSFKSTGYGHKSWGDSDGSGYALDTNDSADIEYFRSGSHGWYDLNALASSLHVYPANATDCQMTNGTVTSDAVMLTFSDATLVLIALGKSYGWKTIDEWAESGWTLSALPTVSISGNFGVNNWLDNGAQSTPTSVSPDSVVTLYIRNLTEIPVYDVTKSYGIIQWQTTAGTTAGRTEFAIVESSGNIAAKNVSSSTLSFYTTRVAVCSSSDATLVTVYDSSNNAYNAFKYTSSGTDYYYVLDGVQTDWTDDLSSIGYSLTIQLPTVSVNGDFDYADNWLAVQGGTSVSVSSGGTIQLCQHTSPYNTPVPYDTSKSYGVIKSKVTSEMYYGFSIINSGGYIYAKNTSVPSASLNILEARIAVCSSSQVDVIAVYNDNISLFTKYNAFRYTINGKSYYYVLDGVQTDWVDIDGLDALGYYLYQTYVMAMSLDSSNLPTAQTFVADDYWWSRITKNTTKTALSNISMFVNTSYNWGSAKFSNANFNRCFVLVGVYTDSDGLVLARGWRDAFNIQGYGSNNVLGLHSTNGFVTAIMTYRIGLIDNSHPSPEFPTVSTGNNWGTYNWLNTSSGTSESIASDGVSSDLAYNGTVQNYDDTKCYAIATWQENTGISGGHGEFIIINNNGKLAARNVTTGTRSFKNAQVAVTDAHGVTVVTVYDSSNKPYNAFRRTVEGVDYYYVLTSSYFVWTNSLESVGYHL
jgi:hypothetical protein